MINKSSFLEEEIPYKKFEKLGIDKKSLLSMPKEMLEPLINGKVTPLFRSQIKTENGKTLEIPMKLQLTRGAGGEINLLTYPIRKEILNDLGLNSNEMEKIKKGQVIKKELNENGVRKQTYVQLDKETNSLMQKSVATLKISDKLHEMEKIKDIELGSNQKQSILEGKPVELNVGNQKVSVGVDLKEPQGFKVVNGDMKEWEKQEKIKYDFENKGFMGYVMTDQNRWEYQEVVNSLSMKKDRELSLKQENRSQIKL